MSAAKILVVDDEPAILDALSYNLGNEGYQVLAVDSGERAVAKAREEKPEVVLLDMKMPGMDGIETLRQIRDFDKESSIIILTAYGTMENVVKAMRLGAYDYISKPFHLEKLKSLIKESLEIKVLAREVPWPEKPGERYKFENIVGKNPKMFEVYKKIGKVVDSKATVLIRGETGTGKELVARATHFGGILKDGPFIPVDCASLPKDLLESELFGHEKGAFTGAIAKKLGKFERASGGTLFLDEVGNLDLATQAKLLRALQEKEIQRVGGIEPIQIEVRIIAATHRDLKETVREGSFREDLYYRLNVVLIHLPPLRERKDDIPLLVECFLHRYRSESKGKPKYVPLKTLNLLVRYSWPGNVRELENVIQRVIVMGKGNAILPQDLPLKIQKISDLSYPTIPFDRLSLEESIAQLEKKLIKDALKETGWVQIKAARLLGVSRRIIEYKMKKYEIKESLVLKN